MPFEPLTLAFIAFALCFSAFIKGALGLGFSTICLAMLANVLPLKEAIAIVLIPSLLSNIQVMIAAGNFRISVKIFWSMLLCAVIGMVIGLMILTKADNTLSILILGIVLIMYGIWGYFNRTFRIKDQHIAKLNPVIGFSTGIVNGATGSQIFPIMPYLLSLNISKDVLILTINLSFTICSTIMLVTMWQIDVLSPQQALSYSIAVIPVVLCVWIGGKVKKHLSENRFRQLSMLLIIALGAGLISKVFN